MHEFWLQFDCALVCVEREIMVATLHQYAGGRAAVIVSGLDGSPYCKLTVNLPEYELGETEFFVKLGDAADAVAEAFAQQGIIERTGRIVSAGFVERYAEVWRLLAPRWCKPAEQEEKNKGKHTS